MGTGLGNGKPLTAHQRKVIAYALDTGAEYVCCSARTMQALWLRGAINASGRVFHEFARKLLTGTTNRGTTTT